MSSPARVQAVDAVDALSAAMRRFQEEVVAVIDELQLEVNRATDWIAVDLRSYWKEAERRAWEEISEARAQLEQARTTRRIAEHEPTCREEKKALQQAQQRLGVASAKLESLRHWSYAVERAVLEFRGGIRPLSLWLEADLPRGLAVLRQMTAALEAYVALQSPQTPRPASAAAPAASDGAAAAAGEGLAKHETEATLARTDDLPSSSQDQTVSQDPTGEFEA